MAQKSGVGQHFVQVGVSEAGIRFTKGFGSISNHVEATDNACSLDGTNCLRVKLGDHACSNNAKSCRHSIILNQV